MKTKRATARSVILKHAASMVTIYQRSENPEDYPKRFSRKNWLREIQIQNEQLRIACIDITRAMGDL